MWFLAISCEQLRARSILTMPCLFFVNSGCLASNRLKNAQFFFLRRIFSCLTKRLVSLGSILCKSPFLYLQQFKDHSRSTCSCYSLIALVHVQMPLTFFVMICQNVSAFIFCLAYDQAIQTKVKCSSIGNQWKVIDSQSRPSTFIIWHHWTALQAENPFHLLSLVLF